MIVAMLARNSFGAPLAGLTPSFTFYIDAVTGLSQPPPPITAVGDGIYKFTPSGSNPCGVIDLGGLAVPRYVVYKSTSTVQVFAAYDEFGVPLPGLFPTWLSLRRVADNTAYTPLPLFTSLGGGLYKTTLLGEHVAGTIDLGATAYPRYIDYDSETLVTEFYLMRAYKTTPTMGYVYWENIGQPDFTGASSGYPVMDLTDIIVLEVDLR